MRQATAEHDATEEIEQSATGTVVNGLLAQLNDLRRDLVIHL